MKPFLARIGGYLIGLRVVQMLAFSFLRHIALPWLGKKIGSLIGKVWRKRG